MTRTEHVLRGRRQGWAIHGAFIGVLALGWLVLLASTPPSSGHGHFAGLEHAVVSLLGLVLAAYAAITTLVVALLGGRRDAPFYVHGLAIAFSFFAMIAAGAILSCARERALEETRELRDQPTDLGSATSSRVEDRAEGIARFGEHPGSRGGIW